MNWWKILVLHKWWYGQYSVYVGWYIKCINSSDICDYDMYGINTKKHVHKIAFARNATNFCSGILFLHELWYPQKPFYVHWYIKCINSTYSYKHDMNWIWTKNVEKYANMFENGMHFLFGNFHSSYIMIYPEIILCRLVHKMH